MSLMFSSSDESAIAFRLKATWMMTVFDILFLCTFTSCLNVSSNLLETRSCGTELFEGLEDAKVSMLILDVITKLSFSDRKA